MGVQGKETENLTLREGKEVQSKPWQDTIMQEMKSLMLSE